MNDYMDFEEGYFAEQGTQKAKTQQSKRAVGRNQGRPVPDRWKKKYEEQKAKEEKERAKEEKENKVNYIGFPQDPM